MLYKEQICRENFDVGANRCTELIVREYVYETMEEREQHITIMEQDGYKVSGGPWFTFGNPTDTKWKFYAMFRRRRNATIDGKVKNSCKSNKSVLSLAEIYAETNKLLKI